MSRKDITKRKKGEVIHEAVIDGETKKMPSKLILTIILFFLFLLIIIIF